MHILTFGKLFAFRSIDSTVSFASEFNQNPMHLARAFTLSPRVSVSSDNNSARSRVGRVIFSDTREREKKRVNTSP